MPEFLTAAAAAQLALLPYNYSELGATRGPLPPGYHHIDQQRQIGSGATVFDEARLTLMSWQVLTRAGIGATVSSAQVTEGAIVDQLIRFGPWRLQAPCRVVYVIDEEHRCGFAYGALQGHPEIGEELFVISRDPGSESVTFQIRSFSRAGNRLTRLGGPVSRRVQRHFVGRYLRSLVG
ncbi:DUF1990 family protein [Nakamurella antarctica]|nr:DUF1990 domain-containing protein [Nakamurella antarctica]